MNAFRWCVGVALVAAGCSRGPQPQQAEQQPASPSGPGRFTHSTIRSTIGPADGPATELILAEVPITDEPAKPHIRIGLHGFPHQWSGRSSRLVGDSLREGWGVYWSNRDDGVKFQTGEVRFKAVVDGQPIEGEYDVTLSDGTRERGRFLASWLPAAHNPRGKSR